MTSTKDAPGPVRAPVFHRPMRATLSHEMVRGDEWLFERKLDGERVIAVRNSGSYARLYSRNGKDNSATYPEIVSALKRQPCERFVIDGEVVAFDGAKDSFARLQQRIGLTAPDDVRNTDVPVFLYIFDMLNVEGRETTRLPLQRRKSLLKQALRWRDPIRFTSHWNSDGDTAFRRAEKRGWEGLIAKRAESEYLGKRSTQWLKLKTVAQQELVIAGFTPPHGQRTGFGALLVGYYDDGELRYAGKVGTGFDTGQLQNMRAQLDDRRRRSSPFADPVPERAARFVEPDLVGEFGFTEWTRDGRLRHPRFLGLRRDKQARDVVREDY